MTERLPTVAELAELYLGNLLYALEVASLSLEGDGRREEAAFHRGIARELAEAHGRTKRGQQGGAED